MNPREIADLISEKGWLYAKARAWHEMLSESKKSLLAKLATQYEGSEATRERQARIDPEYKKYLATVQQARVEELTLKAELDSLNMKFEYWRSMNALKKRELDLL